MRKMLKNTVTLYLFYTNIIFFCTCLLFESLMVRDILIFFRAFQNNKTVMTYWHIKCIVRDLSNQPVSCETHSLPLPLVQTVKANSVNWFLCIILELCFIYIKNLQFDRKRSSDISYEVRKWLLSFTGKVFVL